MRVKKKVWWNQYDAICKVREGIWGRWEARALGMRWVIWGVQCSTRLYGLGSKPGYTTKPAVLFQQLWTPHPLCPLQNRKRPAGEPAAHRGLKLADRPQVSMWGRYFRSWTTMILARNSEDTFMTSPICFFIDFDIGCVPQALKGKQSLFSASICLPKAKRGDESQTSRVSKSWSNARCFQSFSPWFLSTQLPFQAHYHTLSSELTFDEKSGLKRLLSTEDKILLIGTHFLLLLQRTLQLTSSSFPM